VWDAGRFDNNPNLKCPPEEITKGGTNAVMTYLQALDQGIASVLHEPFFASFVKIGH